MATGGQQVEQAARKASGELGAAIAGPVSTVLEARP